MQANKKKAEECGWKHRRLLRQLQSSIEAGSCKVFTVDENLHLPSAFSLSPKLTGRRARREGNTGGGEERERKKESRILLELIWVTGLSLWTESRLAR